MGDISGGESEPGLRLKAIGDIPTTMEAVVMIISRSIVWAASTSVGRLIESSVIVMTAVLHSDLRTIKKRPPWRWRAYAYERVRRFNISDRQSILKTFAPFIFRFLSWRRALFASRRGNSSASGETGGRDLHRHTRIGVSHESGDPLQLHGFHPQASGAGTVEQLQG
jgi:hypothetical protein